MLSLQPKAGPFYASYRTFFADPFLRETVWNTLILAMPTTLLNLLLAVPIAFRVRLMRASGCSPRSWCCPSRSAPCWWRRGC